MDGGSYRPGPPAGEGGRGAPGAGRRGVAGPDRRVAAVGARGFDVPVDAFEDLVADALDSLPEALGEAMANVLVTVEDEAEGGDLFGLYVGVPLTERVEGPWFANPDRIIIYRRTICDHCRSEQEVRALVHTTVIHEVGHHFGIDDPRLEELGWA